MNPGLEPAKTQRKERANAARTTSKGRIAQMLKCGAMFVCVFLNPRFVVAVVKVVLKYQVVEDYSVLRPAQERNAVARGNVYVGEPQKRK